MLICTYCHRLGACGTRRRCTSPRHPDNAAATRRERREMSRRHHAEAIAARAFPFDGTEPDTVLESRRRTTNAILEALERA